MIFWQKLACIAMGYCFGLISTGRIYSKLAHVDIKGQGSHNTGATNALRVAGKKAGAIVFLGDVIKCLIPAIIAGILFGNQGPDVRLFQLCAGLGVILGHMFPFYAGFSGGKGVACTCAICFLVDWVASLPSLLIFVLLVVLTGYVSLGSIVSVICVLFLMLLHNFVIQSYGMTAVATAQFFLLMTVIVGLVIFCHRANIGRLMRGEENKFGHKKQ